MQHLHDVTHRCCASAAWVVGGLLIACALWVSVDVVVRKLFAISIGGATELSGYTLAIVSSWAFAFTLLERAHVRVDTVYRLFPRSVRVILDLLALAALIVFAGVVAWHTLAMVQVSLEIGTKANTVLATPLWIPQGLWLLGWLLFLGVLALLFVRILASIAAGRGRDAERVLGASTSSDRPPSASDQRS